MKRHFLIRFNGCLNGKKKKINLLLLHGVENNEISAHNLEHYLYIRRGKGELGHKNGPGMAGYLEVIRVSNQRIIRLFEGCKLVYISNNTIPKIYKEVKKDLKVQIKEKVLNQMIFIKQKGGRKNNEFSRFRKKRQAKKNRPKPIY